VLFLTVTESTSYDKKYSFREDGKIKPIFPLVLDAYQRYFWDELMKYVEKMEKAILVVCNNPTVTDDVKGRLFELLVVRRCQSRSLGLVLNGTDPDIDIANFPGLESSNLAQRFAGQTLPSFIDDGIYVPVNPNFPAVDLIWKMQENIWFVQVHVSKHNETSARLTTLIKNARDAGEMIQGNLFLLYLSPRQDISALVARMEKLPRYNDEAKPLFRIMAKSMNSFTCFKGLLWPNK